MTDPDSTQVQTGIERLAALIWHASFLFCVFWVLWNALCIAPSWHMFSDLATRWNASVPAPLSYFTQWVKFPPDGG